MNMLPLHHIALLCFTLFLSSCASDVLQLSQSAKKDYQRAERLMLDEDYSRAVRFLEKFTAKYPYSQYATPAELMRLEAAYKNDEFILSETLGLRFIDAHPNHEGRIYAEYLTAMSYYRQSSSAELDQQFSHKARDAFLHLNQRFPNNKYSEEINKYLRILTNRVAEHEMIVGKYYFDKKLYVAAANRFIFVKNNYLNSDIAAESLYWLASSYLALKQKDYAHEIKALMQDKFAQTIWYEKAQQLM